MSTRDDLIKECKDRLKECKIRKSIKLSDKLRKLYGYDKYVARVKEFRWKGKDIICTWCKIDGFVNQSEYGSKIDSNALFAKQNSPLKQELLLNIQDLVL